METNMRLELENDEIAHELASTRATLETQLKKVCFVASRRRIPGENALNSFADHGVRGQAAARLAKSGQRSSGVARESERTDGRKQPTSSREQAGSIASGDSSFSRKLFVPQGFSRTSF